MKPASSAGITYLRTVLRSMPSDSATTSLGRPAYQCSNTSTTSITTNDLLTIWAPCLGDGKERGRLGDRGGGFPPTWPGGEFLDGAGGEFLDGGTGEFFDEPGGELLDGIRS